MVLKTATGGMCRCGCPKGFVMISDCDNAIGGTSYWEIVDFSDVPTAEIYLIWNSYSDAPYARSNCSLVLTNNATTAASLSVFYTSNELSGEPRYYFETTAGTTEVYLPGIYNFTLPVSESVTLYGITANPDLGFYAQFINS